jgi:hypothetical protein
MRLAQIVRMLVFLLMLGPAGLVLGCSGQQDPVPRDAAKAKEIRGDFRSDRKEMKTERAKAKEGGPSPKEMMKEGRRARGGQ